MRSFAYLICHIVFKLGLYLTNRPCKFERSINSTNLHALGGRGGYNRYKIMTHLSISWQIKKTTDYKFNTFDTNVARHPRALNRWLTVTSKCTSSNKHVFHIHPATSTVNINYLEHDGSGGSCIIYFAITDSQSSQRQAETNIAHIHCTQNIYVILRRILYRCSTLLLRNKLIQFSSIACKNNKQLPYDLT